METKFFKNILVKKFYDSNSFVYSRCIFKVFGVILVHLEVDADFCINHFCILEWIKIFLFKYFFASVQTTEGKISAKNLTNMPKSYMLTDLH
jgi:hypothetical protein